MMLVKIGRTILNLDRVTFVRDLSNPGSAGPIVVEFGEGHSLQIHEQAAALRAWLDARALVPGPLPDPGPVPVTS